MRERKTILREEKAMQNKFYTGVGSRETPRDILNLMLRIAKKLGSLGYILRTGDASGADQAFRIGAQAKRVYTASDATSESMEIAKRYHGAWHRVKSFGRKLHARNSFQVLGDNLDTPSAFLICWTPDGIISHQNRSIKTGGTGTAISIASEANIPVYNLAREDHRNRLEHWLLKKGGR